MAVLVAAVVQARKPFCFGSTRHVKGTFNGARSPIFNAKGLVLRIHAHIEESVKAQSWRQQACFATGTELVQVGNAGPVFVGGDVQVFNHPEEVGQDAVHDLLGSRVAAILVQAAGQAQEFLHFGSIENLFSHGVSPVKSQIS